MYEIKLTPQTREEFERVAFVLKARSKEGGDSPFTTVVHVERTKTGSRLIATDRKRIHIAEVGAKIREGDYRPNATKELISFGKQVPGIKFPDWTKVIPEKSRKRCVIDLGHTGLGRDKKQTAAFSAALKNFIDKTGEIVNLGYLEDLPKREWSVYKETGKNKFILLRPEKTAKGVLAVIVPMNAAAA
jgi:hypothetical protein